MTDPAFESAVRAAIAAFNDRRFEDFSTYVTEDLVETYPQSGEVMRGRAAERAMHEAFPEPPTFVVRRILQDGALAVVELDENYNDSSTWKSVLILELRDGRICGLTGYFGSPFAAPAWRRPFLSPNG